MNIILEIQDLNSEYIKIRLKQNNQNLNIKCKYSRDDEYVPRFPNSSSYIIDKTKECDIFYKDKLLFNITLIKYFGTIKYSFWKCITCDKQIYLGLYEVTKKIHISDDITCIYEKQDNNCKEIRKTDLYGDDCFNISNVGIYKFLIDNKIFKIVKTDSENIDFIDSKNIYEDYLITQFL
jgi:hypothetical protein